jgi:hypothetical protein
LKIERDSSGATTTVRLIGHFQSEHIEELKKQLQRNGPRFVFNLEELTIVDLDVVRFLASCEADGVEILYCSRYIREWMTCERSGAT